MKSKREDDDDPDLCRKINKKTDLTLTTYTVKPQTRLPVNITEAFYQK